MNIGLKKKSKTVENREEKNSIIDLLGVEAFKKDIVKINGNYVTYMEVLPINAKLKSEAEQDFITDSYEELLKILRAPFFIQTIAKKGDAKAHIEYIQSHYETEENENVKAMIREYQKYVTDISFKNSVKKRFIVMIPFVVPAGVNIENLSFVDIQSSLYEKRTQFKEAISKCGNEVVEPEDGEHFSAQILYELLNIKSSERERLVIL